MTEELKASAPSRVMSAVIILGCMLLGGSLGVGMAFFVGYMMSS